MTEKTFIVWSSETNDPDRAQLLLARDTVDAHPSLTLVQISGDAQHPAHLLVTGSESTLRDALTPLSPVVQIEENARMQPL